MPGLAAHGLAPSNRGADRPCPEDPLKPWTAERARYASLCRSRTPDDPDLLAARRDLRASRAEDYIRALVDTAPPLTAEQRTRLAALLAPAVTERRRAA